MERHAEESRKTAGQSHQKNEVILSGFDKLRAARGRRIPCVCKRIFKDAKTQTEGSHGIVAIGKIGARHAIGLSPAMLSRNQKILLASFSAVAVGAGIWWKVATPSSPTRPPPLADVMPVELLNAIADNKQKTEQKPASLVAKDEPRAEMVFERNGANTLQLKVTNGTKQPFSVNLPAGTVLQGDRAGVILLKSFDAKVPPGGTQSQDLVVAALSSANQGDSGKFTSSSKTQPGLAPLILHLESHSAVPVSVVQTAVLAILEDAPVDLFARFPRPQAGDAPAVETFKVDTCEIIAAIQLLREIGVDSSKLSQDPQLKIEAMIDPKAHDIAMQYYGITADSEWLYWRHELLEGDPSTRHYALYGIARFYPDVALQMMPKWARESRTAPHFRRAAIGALALTQKSEARPLLQALGRELVRENELAQRVEPALRYLDQNSPNAL